jgi:Flp pilus assembly protein protease CpaA
MYEVIFLWALALIWIIFAIIQDLKTREIANWLNFSLAVFALGFRFFYSLFNNDSFTFFYEGVIGLIIFFLVGNLFYYGKIFAGGDAKLMISLGAILPLSIGIIENLKSFLNFLVIFLVLGAIYVLTTSFFLCIKNFKNFKKEFLIQFNKNKKFFVIVSFLSVFFILLSFLEILFLFVGILILFSYFLFLFSVSIDETCMVVELLPSKLSEGDWLYSDIKLKNQILKKNWDGLTKQDIQKLIKLNKKVKIRQGIPFSPAFLIGFIGFISFKIFNINLWDSFW